MITQNQLSEEKTIRRIKKVHHAEVDLENENFDVYDQLLACESIAEAEEEERKRNGGDPLSHTSLHKETKERTNESVSVKDNVNGTYKRSVNSELNESKLQVIEKLKACDYRTTPRQVEKLLQDLFIDSESKDGHWLYVAQHWTPRAINRAILQMNKLHRTGEQTIKNPAAYFTYLLTFRKKRKKMRRGLAKYGQ